MSIKMMPLWGFQPGKRCSIPAIYDIGKPTRAAGKGNGLGACWMGSGGMAPAGQWTGELDCTSLREACQQIAAVGIFCGGKKGGPAEVCPARGGGQATCKKARKKTASRGHRPCPSSKWVSRRPVN